MRRGYITRLAVISFLMAVFCRGVGWAEDNLSSVNTRVSGLSDQRLFLIRDPEVQSELTLTKDQLDRLSIVIRELDAPLFALRDYRAGSDETAVGPLLVKLEAGLTSIEQILKIPQRRRLTQIAWQAEGFVALASPEVAGKLHLTSQQRQRVRTIIEKTQKAFEKLNEPTSANVSHKSFDKKARQLRNEQQEKLSKVLSIRQVQQWGRMLGKPFDFSHVKPMAMKAPELRKADAWINSQELTLAKLRGQVVVVHFWTFGCINCIRNWPMYKAWHEVYSDRGLTIIGIHTPETSREHDIKAVRHASKVHGLKFPIAIDNRKQNWDAWSNRVWPSIYLIDKKGRVRYWWYGELNWGKRQGDILMRARIDQLLAEDDDNKAILDRN